MNYEIVIIINLLDRILMEHWENCECFYDRIPRKEVEESERQVKNLKKILNLFEEFYPKEYQEAKK